MPTTTEPIRNTRLAEALARDGRHLYVVAGATGVCNPRYLAKLVRGTQQPSPAVKARLAAVLNVPEDELFED